MFSGTTVFYAVGKCLKYSQLFGDEMDINRERGFYETVEYVLPPAT